MIHDKVLLGRMWLLHLISTSTKTLKITFQWHFRAHSPGAEIFLKSQEYSLKKISSPSQCLEEQWCIFSKVQLIEAFHLSCFLRFKVPIIYVILQIRYTAIPHLSVLGHVIISRVFLKNAKKCNTDLEIWHLRKRFLKNHSDHKWSLV